MSSPARDLRDERWLLVRTLLDANCIPVGMEFFPAIGEDQWEYIKRSIDESDYVVLLMSGRYGSTHSDGSGYTEKEYDYARSRNKTIIPLLRKTIDDLPADKRESDPALDRKLIAFRERVKQEGLLRWWSVAAEIPGQLHPSLQGAIDRFPAIGWVRDTSLLAESEVDTWLRGQARIDNCRSFDFLCHANSSHRQDLILGLLRNPLLKVKLAVQDPEHSGLPERRDLIKKSLAETARATLDQGTQERLEVRLYREQASVRMALIRDSDSQPVACAVGWYLHRENDRTVPGAKNPSLVAEGPTSPLVVFAREEFQAKWTSAHAITLDDILS